VLNTTVICFFFYLSFFIKIYCVPDLVSFTALSPISFVAGMIIYWGELLESYKQHYTNFTDKKHILSKMIEKYGDSNMSVMQHEIVSMKINFGIMFNMVVIPCFFYGFLVALCMKFDGMIKTSIFTLLIPLWVIILPLIIFIVINGIATRNSSANKCEKISLSLMVPCKFIYANYF
jgi:hypothetical protein